MSERYYIENKAIIDDEKTKMVCDFEDYDAFDIGNLLRYLNGYEDKISELEKQIEEGLNERIKIEQKNREYLQIISDLRKEVDELKNKE